MPYGQYTRFINDCDHIVEKHGDYWMHNSYQTLFILSCKATCIISGNMGITFRCQCNLSKDAPALPLGTHTHTHTHTHIYIYIYIYIYIVKHGFCQIYIWHISFSVLDLSMSIAWSDCFCWNWLLCQRSVRVSHSTSVIMNDTQSQFFRRGHIIKSYWLSYRPRTPTSYAQNIGCLFCNVTNENICEADSYSSP